jgi:hypothetical protein
MYVQKEECDIPASLNLPNCYSPAVHEQRKARMACAPQKFGK